MPTPKKNKYEESKKIARITYPDSFFQFTHEQVYALFEKHIEHLDSIATGLCKSSHPRVYWRHEQYFNGRKGKKELDSNCLFRFSRYPFF